VYQAWPWDLPETAEVYAVQYPGRGFQQHQLPLRHLSSLVGLLSESIAPLLDKPFAFFGHSMGALVAFELTRMLRRQNGPQPFHLYVSGFRAPQLPKTGRDLHRLSDPDLVYQLGKFNGTPAEVLEAGELMSLILPTIRADFEVCETYAYQAEPPLACALSAFGGLQDSEVPRERLEAWRTQTTGPFTVRMFLGDHFYLKVSQPIVLRILARELYRPLG
jgi:medium-chain acyl-[acyl-carrier-protein] hydrolase